VADNKIEVEIEVLIKQAEAAVKKLESKIEDIGPTAERTFGKVDAALAVFAGNIITNVAGRAFGFLTDSILGSVKAAQEQEDAIASMNIALKNTGIFTETTARSLQAFSGEMQEASVFGDEFILQNAALIQSLGQLDQQGLKRATKAAIELAAGLRIDLTSAAQLVGKAAAGETGAFGRYGIVIEETGTKAEKFERVLQTIESRFGGSSQAQVDTFSGSIAQLANAWSDLQEEVGAFVTNNEKARSVISFLTNAIQGLTGSLAQSQPNLEQTRMQIVLLEKEAAKIFETMQKNKNSSVYNSIIGAKGDDQEKLAKLNAEITKLHETRKRLIDQEAEANAKPKTPNKTRDPEEDGRIARERATIAEINRIRQEQALSETQAEIEQRAAQEGITAQDIEDIRVIEDAKALAQLEAKMAGNQALKTEEERRLADQKSLAEAEVAISKNTMAAKAKLAEMERIREQQRVANQKDTLATIATLSSSSNKELAIIGKAAGLTQIAIDTPVAIGKALSAFPPPFNFAAAAAVGAAMAAQAARLTGIGGFAGGGVVGGFGGATSGPDNQLATVRSGEMFLNAPQQKRLFEMVNGQGSNNNSLAQAVQSLANSPVIVMIDKKEVARAVRNARLEGFVA
jgi:hypothetical protein